MPYSRICTAFLFIAGSVAFTVGVAVIALKGEWSNGLTAIACSVYMLWIAMDMRSRGPTPPRAGRGNT